jgi:predicted nucleic acid-binding protein
MSEVFVDSHAWVALRIPSDADHELAWRVWGELTTEHATFVTSHAVLSETYTFLTRRAGHSYAVGFGRTVRQSSDLVVVYVDRELDEAAWRLFLRYSDKAFSYVDCISFATMEQRGVWQALTYDHHFEQAGFQALLRTD